MQEPLTSNFPYDRIKKKHGFRFFLSIFGNVSDDDEQIFPDFWHESEGKPVGT